MRLHRFYIGQKIGESVDTALVGPELIHQWRKVLRFKEGDKVILFDGSGMEYETEIKKLEKENVDLGIIEARPVANIPKRSVSLFPSLIKKDKIEWVLEKGTELGIMEFAPIVSERSEKKGFDADRARKIAREASEQSGRGTVPRVHDAFPLIDAVSSMNALFIAFDPKGEKFEIANINGTAPIGVLVGPEGGWSDAELQFFKEKNIPVYLIGNQILRAETASIAITSLLLL